MQLYCMFSIHAFGHEYVNDKRNRQTQLVQKLIIYSVLGIRSTVYPIVSV